MSLLRLEDGPGELHEAYGLDAHGLHAYGIGLPETRIPMLGVIIHTEEDLLGHVSHLRLLRAYLRPSILQFTRDFPFQLPMRRYSCLIAPGADNI